MTGAIRDAVRELARFGQDLSWSDLPAEVRASSLLVLTDTLGVTIAGARTPELIALRETWRAEPGGCTLADDLRRISGQDAMWLNAMASCWLDLDEGNKFVKGHPSAHVLFALLAEAELSHASGAEFLGAFVFGHEVASRFGRATTLRPGLHTHGHWGALGAAAAVARLRGAPAAEIAAAIDAAAGLVLATPWESALRGSFVRNTWMGAANVAGTVAANLSRAGLASVDGTPSLTLGDLLGELDVGQLTDELGERFDLPLGYLKRHASCSYTHPPIDAVLELRGAIDVDAITEVLVESHRLAAPLARVEVPTRLAGMFSIPYVVAIALLEGAVTPESFDRDHRDSATVRVLMDKIKVQRTDEMDQRLPHERAARVTVVTSDGRRHRGEVSNPVGDAANQPFGSAEVLAKLTDLLDGERVGDLDRAVRQLADSPSVDGLGQVMRGEPYDKMEESR